MFQKSLSYLPDRGTNGMMDKLKGMKKVHKVYFLNASLLSKYMLNFALILWFFYHLDSEFIAQNTHLNLFTLNKFTNYIRVRTKFNFPPKFQFKWLNWCSLTQKRLLIKYLFQSFIAFFRRCSFQVYFNGAPKPPKNTEFCCFMK